MSGARKTHPGIKPSLGLAPRTAKMKIKPEYLEACKVLSEETMSQACSLVLNTDMKKYDEEAIKGEQDELLEIFQKCCKAAQIVEREAPSQQPKASNLPLMSSLPAARAGMKAGRNTQTKAPATKTTMPTARRMARSLQAPKGQISAKGGQLKRSAMQRQESESSLDKRRGSMVSGIHPKKPRLARPASPTSNDSTPPQSALQFLAKLNNNREHESAAPTRSKSPSRPRRGSSADDSSPFSSKSKRSSPPSSEEAEEDPSPAAVAPKKSPPSGRSSRNSTKSDDSPPSRPTRSSVKAKEKESPSSLPEDDSERAPPTRVQPSRRSKR